MLFKDAGDLPQHREAIRLALQRGDVRPLVVYLRWCAREQDGAVSPALVQAIAKTQFSMHHPKLHGSGVTRFNRRGAFIIDKLRNGMVRLNGRFGPEFCTLLADMFDGLSNGQPILQLKVKMLSSRGSGNQPMSKKDEHLIAKFLAKKTLENSQVGQPLSQLSKATVQDAIKRYGCSRAKIYGIWKAYRNTAFGIGSGIGLDLD